MLYEKIFLLAVTGSCLLAFLWPIFNELGDQFVRAVYRLFEPEEEERERSTEGILAWSDVACDFDPLENETQKFYREIILEFHGYIEAHKVDLLCSQLNAAIGSEDCDNDVLMAARENLEDYVANLWPVK